MVMETKKKEWGEIKKKDIDRDEIKYVRGIEEKLSKGEAR